MFTEPDNTEVVATAGDAAGLPSAPLLILDRITKYLEAHGIGEGPLAWQRIGDGQSNITYRLRRGDQDIVLRRGPRPPLPRSTHDMVREARIQQLLRPEGFPVPRILTVCSDETVLGVPFYVMEALDGAVLTDTIPEALSTPQDRARTSEALVDTLVHLHSIDVTRPDFAAFGRPDGYLERQVTRFSGLWDVNTTRTIPGVAELGTWLRDNIPTSQAAAIVHGDYRLGNLMYRPQSPARVLAVLDWEMAALGDPLADLGYLTATYTDTNSTPTPLELSPITGQPGYPSSADIAKRYATQTGLDITPLPWYQALALWKAAIFCEAIYTRWLKGERPHDNTFGPSLKTGVPQLLELAAEYSAGMR